MATWRCPNCRTVQGDSSRCFLCGRSATSCGTCAHFRQSVVGGLGYCGLDKKRSPLTGDEQRSCWTGAIDQATDGVFAALSDLAEATRPPLPQPRGDVRPVSGQ